MHQTPQEHHCLIIGGGLSGLMAATLLRRNHYKVTVLDKGRGIGGRLATRRIAHPITGEGVFDYGAQYFTAKTPRFQKWVQEWITAGIVRKWSEGFCMETGHLKTDCIPRYIGTKGIRIIAKHLARSLPVHTSTLVTRIKLQDGFWEVFTQQGEKFTGNSLILTPPIPQTLALLQSDPSLPAASLLPLQEKIFYQPCIAVLALLKHSSSIPFPGGLWGNNNGAIQWMADNHQKGISEIPAVTIHATPLFSQQHWQRSDEQVANILFEAASPFLGSPVLQFQIHRWLYSLSAGSDGAPYRLQKLSAPLLLAGDAFTDGRIEGAALSGMDAAEALLQHQACTTA